MVKLFVEGGGDKKDLRIECREGFRKFLTKTGLKNRPKIIACGGRIKAFENFCTAIKNDEEALLLVDSETAVNAQFQRGEPDTWQPWQHLKNRVGDGWEKPVGATDTQCHLMVQVMESWFLADRDTLKAFFGQGFDENKLPSASNPIEHIEKPQVYRALEQATQNCKTKSPYDKGAHSFKLLASIDPHKVTQASPWAKRFMDELRKKMDGK